MSAAAVKLDRKGTHRRPATWNELVNSQWNGAVPILSPDESVKAAKRLYRHVMGKPWTGPVEVTSGNRHTWIRWDRDRRAFVFFVNPDERRSSSRGLREIIHSVSHLAHERLHPNDAPHSKRQAKLEAKLVRYAIRSGFADGKLAPKPKVEKPAPEPKPKPDKVQVRYAAICKREAKWQAQLDQAKRLLAKAQRERRDYERRHGERVTGAR